MFSSVVAGQLPNSPPLIIYGWSQKRNQAGAQDKSPQEATGPGAERSPHVFVLPWPLHCRICSEDDPLGEQCYLRRRPSSREAALARGPWPWAPLAPSSIHPRWASAAWTPSPTSRRRPAPLPAGHGDDRRDAGAGVAGVPARWSARTRRRAPARYCSSPTSQPPLSSLLASQQREGGGG